MTAARVVVVNAGVPAVPRKLAQAFAEDAVAIASWAEAHGFAEDAEEMRRFAARLRGALAREAVVAG